MIEGPAAAEPLVRAVYERVLKAGGHPIINMEPDGAAAIFFEHASDEQIQWVSPTAAAGSPSRPTSGSA